MNTNGNRRQERQEFSPSTAEAPIRVAIVEDSERTLQALRVLLEGTSGFSCVGAFTSAEDALRELPELRPDIVLVDIHLPGMAGPDFIRQIRGKLSGTRFMILTVFEDHDRIFESLRAGAGGYLLKKTPPAGLIAAIEELHAGGAPMSAPIAAQVVAAFRVPLDEPMARLSPREGEVLSFLNRGLLYKEVADQLGISVHTVRSHIARIYEKLEVRSRSQAMLKVTVR